MVQAKKYDQHGSHVVALLLVIVVIGIVGFAAMRVMSKEKTTQNDGNTAKNSTSQQSAEPASQKTDTPDVVWTWGGDKWLTLDGPTVPCSEKTVFNMPVDTAKVVSVLYPGQQRSTGYKTHGGFRFNNADNKIDVTIPVNSHLTQASRYIEGGELQYFMVFTLPCGYAYRFDHLRALTPKFQAIMDKLPEAKVDDTRTTRVDPAVALTAGEKIATEVGVKGNTFMDFGIYYLHEQNEASKNAAYASKHAEEKEFAYYGVCFIDYFSNDITTKLKSLPAADQTSGKTSDYCK